MRRAEGATVNAVFSIGHLLLIMGHGSRAMVIDDLLSVIGLWFLGLWYLVFVLASRLFSWFFFDACD
jgi:hypothetical protein